MLRLAKALLAITVAVGLAGCTSSSLARHPEVKKAQERLPFELVLPESVPYGFVLEGVRVNDNLPVGNRVEVELVFKEPEATADDPEGFVSIAQSNQPINPVGPGRIQVEVGDVKADYLETETPAGTLRVLAFQANQVWVALQTNALSKEDLIAMAEAMLG